MSTPSIRLAGIFLLALALLLPGCGGDDTAPTRKGASSPTDAPRDDAAAGPPTDVATEDASGSEATNVAPTETAAPTDAPRRIRFVDGFAQGAALAKEGDILLVYVGLHDPT